MKNETIEIFSPQEKKYFSRFYPNYVYQKENNNKISFKVKDIKDYLINKHIEKTRYKLFCIENKKINIKSEWRKYLDSDKKYFKNFQEEKIETSDNLRYTDFIEKYDINGNLKERSSVLYRQSISSRVLPESNKNMNTNPILGNLISRHNDNFNNELQKVSDTDEEKDNYNDDNLEKNDNFNNDEFEEKNKESNNVNKIDIKEENNNNEIKEENNF